MLFRYTKDNNFKRVKLYRMSNNKKFEKRLFFFPKDHIILKTKAIDKLKTCFYTGQMAVILAWNNKTQNDELDIHLIKYNMYCGELNNAIMMFGESYGELKGIKFRIISDGDSCLEVEKGLDNDTIRKIVKSRPIQALYGLGSVNNYY